MPADSLQTRVMHSNNALAKLRALAARRQLFAACVVAFHGLAFSQRRVHLIGEIAQLYCVSLRSLDRFFQFMQMFTPLIHDSDSIMIGEWSFKNRLNELFTN